MDDNMEGGAWSRRSSSNEEGKSREACSFLQVEEMYPDQEEALRAFLKEVIFLHTSYFRPITRLKQKYNQFTKYENKPTAASFKISRF